MPLKLIETLMGKRGKSPDLNYFIKKEGEQILAVD